MSTTEITVIVLGILVLSYLSGMLGLGVAFAAVPFLSFFLSDLVNEVQPLSLLLNGATALVAGDRVRARRVHRLAQGDRACGRHDGVVHPTRQLQP